MFGEFYDIDIFNPFTSSWRLITGVFIEKILPLFDYFDLIKLSNRDTKKIDNLKELKIKITPLGNQFFSYMTNFINPQEDEDNDKI